MDIPVTVKKTSAEDKPEVQTPPSQEEPGQPISTDVKDANFEAVQEANKSVDELVQSKKYVLPIHEKRTPLLTFTLLPRKSKRSKKKVTQKTKSSAKKQSKRVETSKQKLLKVGVIVLLWVGLYAAIDMGMIDIGVQVPVHVLGKKSPVTNLSVSGEGTGK